SILVDLVEMIRLNPRPLRKLESIITVGGPIAGAYAAEAARLFNSTVTNVYGSTETGIVSLATDEWFTKPGASGRIVPWIRLEVTDDSDKPLMPGREGQIRVKLDPTFAVPGYIHKSGVDEESIRNGWFYPGDLGYLAGNGALTITGRVRELINTGGNKISPTAVEEQLSSIRGIANLAAVGVRNESGFDTIGIAICRKPEVPLSEIRKEIARRLNFAGDTLVVDVERLPLNSSGKIDRVRLRALFQ
ncbi:MAG: AMP-binding protein, partial [Rhizobiales bacterium]|nr:AMP-binding protein [Hyphomicrobiales bacterium]